MSDQQLRDSVLPLAHGMTTTHPPIPYRKDIDGLRAISVVAVLLFHAGLLAYGYLGVDVFFVISGFLITGIIKAEVDRDVFSFRAFYERRLRRIIPLALVVSAVSLVAGTLLMLPDDLENLAQSVVATNFFSNNILQEITTGNYWDVVNEYKPLLHTWSLGVEEQFYLVWPLLLLFSIKRGAKFSLVAGAAVVVCSYLLFIAPLPEQYGFYLLPFRFFELAVGGLMALIVARTGKRLAWSHWALIPLVAVLLADVSLGGTLSTTIVVVASALLVISSRPEGSWYRVVMENPLVVYVGAISYSLYMWHQPIFAFARYAFFDELDPIKTTLLLALTIVISAISYRCVEQPFRNRRAISLAKVLVFVIPLFVVTTCAGLWLHFNSGVIRNVPELDIVRGEAGAGLNARYNHRIYDLDRDFTSNKIHVLVVGNSFARDWANVLMESDFADRIEISYHYETKDLALILRRVAHADVVFLKTEDANPSVLRQFGEAAGRIYVLGPKNYGKSSGIFYNHRRDAGYFTQRVLPDADTRRSNDAFRAAYGERFVDMMTPIADANGRVPVFTPEGKFISQDCRHLTKAGAAYYAHVLHDRIAEMLARRSQPFPAASFHP